MASILYEKSQFSVSKYETALSKFCTRCMGGQKNAASKCTDTSCPFYEFVKTPKQISVFGDLREPWYTETLHVAETMQTPFWFSDLVKRCGIAPGHCNWWGTLTKRMRKHGFKRLPECRRSPLKSRRGGDEHLWTKVK